MVEESTLIIRRRVDARRVTPYVPRKPSRLEVWARSPIIILRAALVLTYALCVWLGVVSWISIVPVFEITAPDWFQALWSMSLAVGGSLACVGSVHDSKLFRWVELVGAVAVLSASVAYAVSLHWVGFGQGDITRQVGAVAVTIITVLPGCRVFWLLGKLGTKKA